MIVVILLIIGLDMTGFWDEVLFGTFSDIFDLLEILFKKFGGDWFEK